MNAEGGGGVRVGGVEVSNGHVDGHVACLADRGAAVEDHADIDGAGDGGGGGGGGEEDEKEGGEESSHMEEGQ